MRKASFQHRIPMLQAMFDKAVCACGSPPVATTPRMRRKRSSQPRFATPILSATNPMLGVMPERYRYSPGEIARQILSLASGEKMRF